MKIPKRRRGRQSTALAEAYRADLVAFCEALEAIDNTLDIKVSSRGWCYALEEHGLGKDEFDYAQRLINDCRKSGLLPVDFTASDESRRVDGLLGYVDHTTPAEEAMYIVDDIWDRVYGYSPIAFWDDQIYYAEMLVEKIDLKSIFKPVCSDFNIPIGNAKGWSDINSRADMMRRFSKHEREGRRCVLLMCNDFDPGGLAISNTIKSNLNDLAEAVGWNPDNLIVDRFGLNADFIESSGLSWIDNLETSSGKRLDNPKHKDHHKPYVQDYLKKYGVRKCEANSLVVNVKAGRDLCRDAITSYVTEEAVEEYDLRINTAQDAVREALPAALKDAADNI